MSADTIQPDGRKELEPLPEIHEIPATFDHDILTDIIERPEDVATFIHETYIDVIQAQVTRKKYDMGSLERQWDTAQLYLKEFVAHHNGESLLYLTEAREHRPRSCPSEQQASAHALHLLASQVEAHELALQYVQPDYSQS